MRRPPAFALSHSKTTRRPIRPCPSSCGVSETLHRFSCVVMVHDVFVHGNCSRHAATKHVMLMSTHNAAGNGHCFSFVANEHSGSISSQDVKMTYLHRSGALWRAMISLCSAWSNSGAVFCQITAWCTNCPTMWHTSCNFTAVIFAFANSAAARTTHCMCDVLLCACAAHRLCGCGGAVIH